MSLMSIIVTREGAGGPQLQKVDPGVTVDELLREVAPDADDLCAFVPDVETPLDGGSKLTDAGLAEDGEITIARAKKVDVTVRYAGDTRGEARPRSQRMRRVLHWALGKHGFDIPKEEQPHFELAVAGGGEAVDLDATIAQYVPRNADAVTFDLRRIKAPQG